MTATDLANTHLPADAVSQLQATDPVHWIHGHGFPGQSPLVDKQAHQTRTFADTILGDSITRADIFNIADQPSMTRPQR